MYSVKEIFYTLQGEGINAGRAAVFCRFSGCNLWSGRAQDRTKAACTFCDTDFVGTDGLNGGKYTASSLAQKIASLWPATPSGNNGSRLVVCTGGEPLLQLDAPLIEALHAQQFEIAIETNGTLPVPAGIDWVCVSPKAGNPLVVSKGNELKVVVPQAQASLKEYEALEFDHFLVQPMAPLSGFMPNEPNARSAIDFAIAWCKDHPRWRLSLQTHKYLNIP